MQNTISAGIILYNPEYERLKNNIKIIENQVEHIYLYNNGTQEELIKELSSNSKLIILGSGENIVEF